MKTQSRRDFLQFLGRAGVVTLASSSISLVQGCTSEKKTEVKDEKKVPFPIKAIAPSLADELRLAEGLNYHIITSWGDAISDKDSFGFNNDYLAFIVNDLGSNIELFDNLVDFQL